MTDTDELLEELDRLAEQIGEIRREIKNLKLLYRLQYPEEMEGVENGEFVFGGDDSPGYTVVVKPSDSADGWGRFECEGCGEVYPHPGEASRCCS